MRRISGFVVAILMLATCAQHQPKPQPGVFPKLVRPEPSGVLKLHFKEGYTKQQQKLIRNKLTPYLDQVFGKPWQTMDIDVYGGKNSPSPSTAFSHFDNSACEQEGRAFGVIQVKDPSDLGALANELTHAHHGCFTFSDSRFEEGFSYAGNIMASYHLSLKKDPCTPFVCQGIIYQPNNRPGLSGGVEFDHDTTGNLATLRENLGGMAWAQFDNAHPGFLRRVNELMYQQLLRQQQASGGQIRGTALKIDPYQDGVEASPSFTSWYARQYIFAGRPKSDNLFLVAAVNQVIVVATKRDAQGNELPWVNVRVHGVVSASGKPPKTFSLLASNQGEAYLNLKGKSNKPLTITAQVGTHSDRVTYINTWPNSPYLGNVPLKP